jgi:N-acetylmuramoyl-L-alanine amidase
MYGTATYNATKDFIDKYGVAIAQAIKGTGLFFPAVVGQKALESGYGKSELASKYNNFGGIKNFGSLSNAGVVILDTTEVRKGVKVKTKQPFATYKDPVAAFKSYVDILKDPNQSYTKLGVFTAKSPEEQIALMVKAGYAGGQTVKSYLQDTGMASIISAARDYSKLGRIN